VGYERGKGQRGGRVGGRFCSYLVGMEALHVGGGRPRPSSHSQQPSAYSSQPASSLVSAAPASASASDGDGNGGPEVRGLDINLGALCDHVQLEGWKSRAFSDIVVKAMGHTFHLHRLLLSRSSYFRSRNFFAGSESNFHF
jgi:hypothetical protein